MPDDKTPNPTIDAAVTDAVKAHPPVAAEEEKPAVEVKKEESAKPEFDPVEARQAIGIINALKDPSKAPDILRLLAKEIGLEVTAGKSQKEATKDALAELKENVPEELHFILEGIKPAIDKMVKDRVAAETQGIRAAQESIQQQNIQSTTDKAYETMRSRYKDFDSMESTMNDLTAEMPYQGGDVVKYLDNLYKIATYDNKDAGKISKAVDKINRNAQDSNVKSAEVVESKVVKGSKFPSADEAVRAAFRGERLH
jgi:phage-related minor tail protein